MDKTTTQDNAIRETIMVVDDHELVLRGIKLILEKAFPNARILTVDTGGDAIRMMKMTPIEMVSVDLELPDMSGFNLIDHIRADHPNVRILVNTVHDEIWTVKRLSERRVEGIIFKSAKVDNFVEAVRRIISGETYYDPSARLLMKSIASQSADEASLSLREIEVLRLIAEGFNTEEIGLRLGLKPNTIETHRRHLLEKLDVRNSAELVRRAVSNGILSPME